MAHHKRTGSKGNTAKKQGAAKQALKKKQRGSIKSKNDAIRETLDLQAHTLHNIYIAADTPTFKPLENAQESIQDLAAILHNL